MLLYEGKSGTKMLKGCRKIQGKMLVLIHLKHFHDFHVYPIKIFLIKKALTVGKIL